jgi:hypothetical protein
MDDFTTQMIKVTESRRNVACSMLAAHGAGQLPLTPDEVTRFRAEIHDCDAELAELRK